MSKTTAIVSSGLTSSSLLPPTYTLAVVSINPLSGKSALCQRLIDSNIDNYRLSLLKNISSNPQQNPTWFYWGSVKHRRSDEKREALFHLIEHSTIAINDNEQYDNYIKRITTLTLRSEEKFQNDSVYPQIKTFPKDKATIDGFLCIHDLSSSKQISDLLFLLHSLFKTRRPILIITTKNDLIENQTNLALQFEQSIRRSNSSDSHLLSHIPIIHTSANEHVNIQTVLELALYACDEPTFLSSRKPSHANISMSKYIPSTYEDAYRNEQSLKHVIQAEYRTLLARHVSDFRGGASWMKFYSNWQHHTSIQTFIDMFGKQQAERLYDEHIEELKRMSKQKLIDERLIPIVELLTTDQKSKLSRNWDYVRLQMQKHPRYSSTVIPTSMWSDAEQTNANRSLIIPDDLLETSEARLCFESYINSRQLEQTRRGNCRSFFDLLNRFSDAGLVQYGHSYEKDCVYFLGRECYESLHSQDRLRVFAFHQSYLYRLLCLKFVELLFESLEIFIDTFHKMNSATTNQLKTDRKITTLTIDDIFEKEIIQQIKHDSRYQALDNRETDRHRLIMCHCHFLYDCIYYPPTRNVYRLIKQHKRSFKRRNSSSLSLYSNNMTIDDNFCPYTRRMPSNTNENERMNRKKFEIGCPMEESCADIRIMNEFFSRVPFRKPIKQNILICGTENDMNNCLQILSNDLNLMNDFQVILWTLNNIKTQSIDGCLIVSPNGREILQDFISQEKFPLNIDTIPIVNLNFQIPAFTTSLNNNTLNENTIEQLRLSLEQLLSNKETSSTKNQSDLRILLCFMCGGENNDIEIFFNQLSARFSVTATDQYGDLSFITNVFLGRTNRKIEFIPVSFHLLFSLKLTDFDGFILFYDRIRKAAVNTMTYLEKHISTILQDELLKKTDDNKVACPPIYVLCCIKDPCLSSINKHLQSDSSVQCHNGTIRNFVEAHLLPFLNQCWTGKNGSTDYEQNENLLAGVTSYFSRTTHSSTNDLMTSSLDYTRRQLLNNNHHEERLSSLISASRSNEHSPKHRNSLLTPTNCEQIFSYRSFPHLSISTNGTDSTIVPTTPVDPSITNLGLLSPSSLSISSISDVQPQQFKKSTSMRFAKLMEHPTDGSSYQSSLNNNENSLSARRRISEISPRLSTSDDMKFHFYKHRTAAHVKVPLATPEIIEFNESITTPFSVQQRYDKSLVFTNNNTNDIHPVNSSSSSPPTAHQQHQTPSSTVDESVTDSSKQTRATDSSVDSSSDEHLKAQRESSTTLHNINSPTNNQQQQQPVVTLQRKVSDRKSKRVRAKQNDVTGLASSTEILKKTGSDDEILADEDKRAQQSQHQKKKRRPSFKRRKKPVQDQAQTDSGIDSRTDSKDKGKDSIAPEPSSVSSNIVISNEDDSSVGDYTKDSKNTSIEELEERPTANWIRRQLQHFAQGRRDKNELKSRSPATTVTSISSPPVPSFKATMTATPPNATLSLLSPLENAQHTPGRLSLSRCPQSNESRVPLFIEKCIQFIEEYGLAIEGLYRVSGYKNQVESVINKLTEDPSYDLCLLQVPATAVATALKDMMRKLDEPLLSLELFGECQSLTIDQLSEQNFLPLRKVFSRTSELKYRTIKLIFKHLHFVSQHAASTHMDSSNLAVLWWPNLFQPQFRDLRTAEQTCQKTKPLIQAIIDNYPMIFSSDEIKQQTTHN